MSNTVAKIAVLCVTFFECFFIFIGNAFTVLVFWIHRNKLKRTSFLLINLAVADLFVGLAAVVRLGAFVLPRNIGVFDRTTHENIPASFQFALAAISMFSLVLISWERAFALIWPLRHRVTANKPYIYGVIITWLSGITLGALHFLAVIGLYDYGDYLVAYCLIIASSLVTICMSYMKIRKKLNYKRPAFGGAAHNKHSVKLSKTIFIVIAASIAFWAPSLVLYCVNHFYTKLFSKFFKYLLVFILPLTNSLVNPIIYSLQMPVFKVTLKRFRNKLRLRKQSARYTVNNAA